MDIEIDINFESNMNIEYDNTSNISPILDSKINEMEKEICKVKNWSDKDIQELLNVLSADQINTLLQNEIHRIDDWFSKTYYHFKSYLIKHNFLKFDKDEFERLKSKMDFISGCLNEDKKIQQNNFYPNEIMEAIKTMEKNKYDKCTVQIIGKSFARCLLCMANVNGNVYDHVLGTRHQLNLSNPAQIELLDSFHVGWCDVPISLRVNEIFFLPYSVTRVKCCICNSFIGYRELLVHVNGRNHQMKIPEEFMQLKLKRSEEKLTDSKVQCEICKVSVSRNSYEEHVKGRNHQEKLKQLNSKSLEKANDNQVQCQVCNVLISRIGYQEHVNGMNHKANLKLLNGKPDNNKYECDVCKVQITPSREGLQEHINEKNHLVNVYKLYLNQSIEEHGEKFETENQIQCDICQVTVSRDEFQKHIDGNYHQTNLKLFSLKYVEKKPGNNEFQCNVCKIQVRGGLQEHINGKNHQENLKFLNPSSDHELRCDICNVIVHGNLEQHNNGKSHQLKLKQITPKSTEEASNPNQVKCDVCNIVVTRNGLQEHINGRKHQTNLEQLSIKSVFVGINDELVHCVICKILVKHGGLEEHINGSNHQNNLKQSNPIMEEEKIVNQIECEVCRIVVDELQEHINSEYHQTILMKLNQKSIKETNDNQDQPNLNQLPAILNEEIDENQVQCAICKVVITRNSSEEHINERDHQTTLYQINMKDNKSMAGENPKYSCDICNIEFPQHRLQRHIQEQKHRGNLMQINLHQLKSINEKLSDTVDEIKWYATKDVIISSPKLSDVNPLKFYTDFYILQLPKTVPRPLTIQKIGSKYFRCLVCKIMFIEVSSLNLHVQSEIHQQNYNNKTTALIIYHKVCETLSRKIKTQQIFFFPHDIRSVFCQVCLGGVEFFKIEEHCNNILHCREIVDGNLWQEIGESVYHEESDRIEKKLFSITNTFKEENVFHLTEQFYSDDLLQKVDIKPHRIEKTILISSPGVYNCLLCHKKQITAPLLERHCLSLAHRSSMKSRFQNNIVRQFHQDWSNFPADFQLHQIYFLPNFGTYSCLCCGKDSIRFTDLLCHTYGSQHINKLKLLSPSEIPKCFHLTDESTQLRLYPESLTALLKEISGNPGDCISFQKHSLFEVKCLVCKTKFENIPSHFLSKKHKQLMQLSGEIIKAVKKYHLEWKKIPENLQIQQLNYEPYDETRIMCNKCKDFLHYENLYYHLTNDHKFIELKTIIPVNSTQSANKIISNLKKSNQEQKFAPFTYYPIHLLQKMRKLEGKIYRNVQMIGESSFRCLLCRLFLDDLDEHISTSDHLKFLSDKELISFVEKFHNSWAIIDNSLQFQQMYFFPASEAMAHCALCLKDINYNKLITHLQVPLHSCLNGLKTSESLSSFNSSNPNLNLSSTSQNSLSKVNDTDSTDSNFNEDEDSESDSSNESSDESGTEKVDKQLNNLSIGDNNMDTQQSLKLKKIWDIMPERFKVHRTVIYWKNGILSCHLCHVNLEPNKDDIIAHIVREMHIIVFKTTGLYERQYDRLFYECLYCYKKIQRSEIDWQAHLKSKKHDELSKLKKFENFVEMHCKTCKTVLYGDKNILRDHKHASKRIKNKDVKMPSYLQLLFKSSDNVNTFVQKIYEEAMEVLMANSQDEKVCEALINAMKPFCKNTEKCKAYRFGSRVTGICTHDSDLDVFLDLNDVYNGNNDQEPDAQKTYVDYTHAILMKSPEIWSHFDPIREARTPILRVFHKPTNIDCDISFRNGLSVENTKLLRFYFDFQPVTRKVILFLKNWSSHFQFSNFRAISNYALSLMVIFYLQTRGFMYSVSQLRNMHKGPPKMIKGWDCTFYDNLKNIKSLPCDLSCIEILRDFFLYYANFNYNEQVVCPLLGRTIKKKDFHLSEDCDTLPEEMKCYKDYIQSNTDPELFKSLSSLCVQDPFDLSHNLTKATPPHTVIKFSKACQISYKSLNDILNNHL